MSHLLQDKKHLYMINDNIVDQIRITWKENIRFPDKKNVVPRFKLCMCSFSFQCRVPLSLSCHSFLYIFLLRNIYFMYK